MKLYYHSLELAEVGTNSTVTQAALDAAEAPFVVLTAGGSPRYQEAADRWKALGFRYLGAGKNRFLAYGPDFNHHTAVWWRANPKCAPLRKLPEQPWPARGRDFDKEPHSFAYCCGMKFFDSEVPETIVSPYYERYGWGDNRKPTSQKTSVWASILRVNKPLKKDFTQLEEDGWTLIEEHDSGVAYFSRNLRV